VTLQTQTQGVVALVEAGIQRRAIAYVFRWLGR
jgi:hypothetical protein